MRLVSLSARCLQKMSNEQHDEMFDLLFFLRLFHAPHLDLFVVSMDLNLFNYSESEISS